MNAKKIHLTVVLAMFFPFPIACLSILIAIIYALLKKEISFQDIKKHPIINTIFLISAIASSLSQNIAGITVTLCLFLLFIYFISFSKHVDRSFFEQALTLISINSWGQAGLAFLQSRKILFGPDYHAWNTAMVSWRDGRADAVFLNPNYYAMMCTFFILIACYKLTTSKQRLFYSFTIGINFIGIILSQARTAIPAVIMTGLIFLTLILPKQQKKWAVFATIGTLLTFPLLQFLPRSNIPTIMNHLMTIRVQIWSAALHHFQKTWLMGSGPFTYMSIHRQYGTYATQHAHNLFLDTLLNYGIIGSFLLSWFTYKIITRVNTLKMRSDYHAIYALGISFISLVFIEGLLDVTILFVHTLYTFLFVIVAIYTLTTNKKST